jgi:hypothetical protein
VLPPLDLRPESADVDIHSSVPAIVIVTPYLVEQGFTGEDPAAVGSEEYQELVFREGKGKGFAIECHLPPSEVDHQVSGSEGDVVESLYFVIYDLPKFDNRYLWLRLKK